MKILTAKEQLRLKINEIDVAIDYTTDQRDKVYNRLQAKQNWGIFSFISEPQWLLKHKLEKIKSQLNLLEEYRDEISNRMIKE